MSHDCAVYAEWSDSHKKMEPEANVRVFNRVEVESKGSTSLDMETGAVSLQPGTYHITASSIVTPFFPETDTDGRVTPQPRPYGGYARLRYADKAAREDTPIALGTISHVNMLPSLIDTYLHVDEPVEIMLDHQAGAHTEDLYLQVAVEDSSWHIFARISIHRL
ncbi:MAG TPA: hypothetical protein VFE05_18905 [Longimicrobiaceae bacterium]|jgi:hypothetical protein|nr:hypothetical protein [Longimicrobiaceae bacterium]